LGGEAASEPFDVAQDRGTVEGDAAETPDVGEFAPRDDFPAADGVANHNIIGSHFKNSNTMVGEKVVLYDSEIHIGVGELVNRTKEAKSAFEAEVRVTLCEGIVETFGQGPRHRSCVGEDGKLSFVGFDAEGIERGNGGGGAAGVIGSLTRPPR
jgi:hypothetical protein